MKHMHFRGNKVVGSQISSARDLKDCVLSVLLEKWSEQQPDATYVVDVSGQTLTYGELNILVRQFAGALTKLGVKRGDRVAVWLPNSIDHIILWFAINALGAVFAPLSVAYRGALLSHVLKLTDASLLIAHGSLLDRLVQIDISNVRDIVVLGDIGNFEFNQTLHDFSIFRASLGFVGAFPDLDAWDTQSIFLTSGTTGPSKAVLSSYRHLAEIAGPQAFPHLDSSDRFFVPLPLFHIGACAFVYGMFRRGGSIAVADGFDTKNFWKHIRQTETSATMLLGAMADFLLKQEPTSEDKSHDLRKVSVLPVTKSTLGLTERFGFEVFTHYSMTEINSPIISRRGDLRPGYCGRVREGVQVRLVDPNDMDVPLGTVGEMVVRADAPWTISHGYFADPYATADAWRNGWFHTGDNFFVDDKGDFFFVDRKKDAIRRRGENVSSWELEQEVMQHPDVLETAAVPVPSVDAEDEILIVVVPKPGRVVDPEHLIRFCGDRMPHYMVPRYVRVMSGLPKTETQKIKKASLKEDGITSDTWDREAFGITYRRTRIV